MNQGMLWVDTSKKPISEKVAQAATHFEKKYGRMPDTCLVNFADLQADTTSKSEDGAHVVGCVTVRPWSSILPNHLWIGMEAILVVHVEEEQVSGE